MNADTTYERNRDPAAATSAGSAQSSRTHSGRRHTMLVVGPWRMGHGSVVGQCLGALWRQRRAVDAELGVRMERATAVSIAEIRAVLERTDAEVVLAVVPWNESPADVVGLFRGLSGRRTKYVFVDSYDQSSSPYLEVLPYVHCYAKRQILRDRQAYARDLVGGYVFTDFLSTQGVDIGDWNFGSRAPREHLGRLCVSWNLGARANSRWVPGPTWLPSAPWRRRRFDLFGRIGVASADGALGWKGWYRERSIGELAKVKGRSVSPSTRVGRWRYAREMANSRIVFSPFGWGELCWRDFEAVAAGALLVKPSVEHLETAPDIFRAGETYVPVRWDLSDLVEKCEYYLDHREEAEEIALGAQRALGHYHRKRGLVESLRGILLTAGLAC